jgi:hypothetical protein
MRSPGVIRLMVVALAVAASCSTNAPGTEGTGGSGGIGGMGGIRGTAGVVGACTGESFSCAYGSDGVCGDAVVRSYCMEGQWSCLPGQIPLYQCRCAGLNPQACPCGDAGWSCPDGGAGVGGNGGAGGTGGGGVSCGNTTCAGGNVCVRQQTVGGACFPPGDGGCPAGSSPGDPCCVRDPTYTCKPLPAACNGTLTCDCGRQALCTSGNICATPTPSEIDCTLQAP